MDMKIYNVTKQEMTDIHLGKIEIEVPSILRNKNRDYLAYEDTSWFHLVGAGVCYGTKYMFVMNFEFQRYGKIQTKDWEFWVNSTTNEVKYCNACIGTTNVTIFSRSWARAKRKALKKLYDLGFGGIVFAGTEFKDGVYLL